MHGKAGVRCNTIVTGFVFTRPEQRVPERVDVWFQNQHTRAWANRRTWRVSSCFWRRTKPAMSRQRPSRSRAARWRTRRSLLSCGSSARLMDLELNGKTAIVTGASRGIGKAIARVLAVEGADVALVARPSRVLEQAVEEIRLATDRTVISVAADSGVDAQVRDAVARVERTFGHIDILVNSAAQPGGNPARLADLTDAAFLPDLNVKVIGYTRFIREVAPSMQRQGWGRVINVVGMAARTPVGIISSVRNAAVVAMSRNVAEQLGPYGITVNVVHPFAVRTERSVAQVRELADREGISFEAAEQRRLGDGNLLQRTIDATEIGYVVAFLASPKGVAVNGESISVSGGTPGWISY